LIKDDKKPAGLVPAWVQIPPPAIGAEIMKFLDFGFSFEESNVVIIGVKIGKNWKRALKKIRRESNFASTFDLDKKINMLEKIRPFDYGNVRVEELKETLMQIKKLRKIPVVISRAHLVSYFISKTFPEAYVVSFDAHSDCKDSYVDEKIEEIDYGYEFDSKLNDSTWFRRSWEEGRRGILLGIRALDEDEYEFLIKNNVPFKTSKDIKNNRLARIRKKEIFFSLDIDVFDPSIAPSVDYPEPGGIMLEDFERQLDMIKGRFCCINLACIKFSNENNVTEFLSTRALFSIFSKLNI